jgi:hypothetical protein
MSEQAEIQYNLTLNADMSFSEIRRLEIVLVRVMSYAQQLTGDPNLKKGIQTIQQAIMSLRMLQIAIRAVQMASGPIGWIYAGTSVLAAGISYGNLMSSIGE